MKIRNILANTSLGIFGGLLMCFSWGLKIGWFGFHILTVCIMFGRHGVIGAIIGFFLPLLSEMYTIAMVLYYQGIKNFYIGSFLVLLFMTILPYAVIAVINIFITLFTKKENE